MKECGAAQWDAEMIRTVGSAYRECDESARKGQKARLEALDGRGMSPLRR